MLVEEGLNPFDYLTGTDGWNIGAWKTIVEMAKGTVAGMTVLNIPELDECPNCALKKSRRLRSNSRCATRRLAEWRNCGSKAHGRPCFLEGSLP